MRSVVAFAVLVLVVPAAGCGNGGGGDLEQAQQAVRDYVVAIADGDGDRACARMSEAAQAQLVDEIAEQEPRAGIDSCEQAVGRVSEQLSAQDRAALRDPQVDVTLNRDKAVASVEDGPSDVTVVKVDGRWLIDAE